MNNSKHKIQNIPVIYYHSVGAVHPHWNRNFLTLPFSFFKDQLRFFSKQYQVISLKKYWEIRNGISTPVKNAMVLTFDDGYLDNWIWAYPLLKKYGLPATIFVSPEFVDQKNGIRPNLDDLEAGRVKNNELMNWGFLSWEEMKEMEKSGLVDVQSHTLTHTKYFVSDKLVDFHHPGADSLYIIGNQFPVKKPYYIGDPGFDKLIPYGYPVLEGESAITARRVWINEDFLNEVKLKFKKIDFEQYNFNKCFDLIKDICDHYKKNSSLISKKETDEEYLNRIDNEICLSKQIIEKKLEKKVEFLCWPHGDSNMLAHQKARDAGYLATTSGSKEAISETGDRISKRIGTNLCKNNRSLTLMRARYRINAFLEKAPYYQINKIYNSIRY